MLFRWPPAEARKAKVKDLLARGDKDQLVAACKRGALDEVQELLASNHGAFKENEEGKELRDKAFRAAIIHGHVEVVEALVEAGADVHAEYGYDSKSEWGSPLSTAVDRGHVDVAAYLIRAGASIRDKDGDVDDDLMDLAIRDRNDEMMALLIEPDAVGEWAEYAVERSELDFLFLLDAHGLDRMNVNENGESLAHRAAFHGEADVLESLIDDRDFDIRALDKHGRSLLHVAGSDCIELLLDKGLDIHLLDKHGQTPLHGYCNRSSVRDDTVELLLNRGAKADINVKDKNGLCPLHLLVDEKHLRDKPNLETILRLLDAGADATGKCRNGKSPLYGVLQIYNETSSKCESTTHFAAIHSFHARGASWDDDCDAYLEKWFNDFEPQFDRARADGADDALETENDVLRLWDAARVCFRLWAEDKEDQPPTVIPRVVFVNGGEAIEEYLNDLRTSKSKFWRSKICVVGPSGWGKTTLVQSIRFGKPRLSHEEDRTLGVDLVSHSFVEEKSHYIEDIEFHEVTFWDFAGQDVYQAAHGLFFSPQTLYLLCVDTKEYTKQLEDADKLEFDEEKENKMNRFVAQNVLRWVETVVARQSDAQFIVVGTKSSGKAKKVWRDLKNRLVTWQTEKNRKKAANERAAGAKVNTEKTIRQQLFHGDETTRRFIGWIEVESSDNGSLQRARKDLEEYVIASKREFPMGKGYYNVLKFIEECRKDAEASTDDAVVRANNLIVKSSRLCEKIVTSPLFENPDMTLKKKYDKKGFVTRALETLRNLGDVLWYKDQKHRKQLVALDDRVILDPRIVVNLVKEVVNHEQAVCLSGTSGEEGTATQGLLTHEQLMKGELWCQLAGQKFMLEAFKSLLVYFELAYPASGTEMEWNSSLIVPSYWEIKSTKASKIKFDDVPGPHAMRWKYTLPATECPTIFRRLAVRIATTEESCRFSSTPTGLAGEIKMGTNVVVHIVLETQETEDADTIWINATGADKEASWFALVPFVATMEELLLGWHDSDENGASGSSSLKVTRKIVQHGNCEDEDADHLAHKWCHKSDYHIEPRAIWPTQMSDFLWYIEKKFQSGGIHDYMKQRKAEKTSATTAQTVDTLRQHQVMENCGKSVPACWRVTYDESNKQLLLEIMSDLEPHICYHDPISIPVPFDFFVKYGSAIQGGTLFSAAVSLAASAVPGLDLFKNFINFGQTKLVEKVNQAKSTSDMREQMALSTSNSNGNSNGNASSSSSSFTSMGNGNLTLSRAKLDELLCGLLTSCDPIVIIRNKCHLKCMSFKNKPGYVWIHESEIVKSNEELLETEPPIAATLVSSSPAVERFNIKFESVTGLNWLDDYKVCIKWKLEHPSTTSAFGEERTTDETSFNHEFELLGVHSLDMLQKCTLSVEAQRRSHRKKSVYRELGKNPSVSLDGVQPQPSGSTSAEEPLRIDLDVTGREVVFRIRIVKM